MSEHLEHNIDARGEAYVILALDLAPFILPHCLETLQQLRGRNEFDEFLENLRLDDTAHRFIRDETYQDIEQKGYELGVFDKILVDDSFAPTYRLQKESVTFPEHLANNRQFKNILLPVWNKWDFWLRLSANGIITIIMRLQITDRKAFAHISRDVLGLQEAFDMESARQKLLELQSALDEVGEREDILLKIESLKKFLEWASERSMLDVEQDRPAVVWQMAVEVVRQFIEACGGRLTSRQGKLRFDLVLTDNISRREIDSLRAQYIVFNFSEITLYERSTKKHSVLTPEEIMEKKEYSGVISGLLEGILLEESDGQQRVQFYPHHDRNYIEQTTKNDLSSWSDEFCILTDRSAVIYCAPHNKRQVIFPLRQIAYSDYWKSVIRGIEFYVETRVLAQSVERLTVANMNLGLPLLDRQVSLESGSLAKLTDSVVNTTRLITHLRTITVPHITSQTSYAVTKFDAFLRQTGVIDILNHAETNLHNLTAMVQRFSDLNLQAEAQRTSEAALGLSVLFAGFSVALSLLALPTYLLDWSKLQREPESQIWYFDLLSRYGEFILLFFTACSVFALFVTLISLYRIRRRRKHRLL